MSATIWGGGVDMSGDGACPLALPRIAAGAGLAKATAAPKALRIQRLAQKTLQVQVRKGM